MYNESGIIGKSNGIETADRVGKGRIPAALALPPAESRTIFETKK